MNRINELKDETIKTLAQTLKESGLAASETEAIRMATNMAQTNKKANDTFEERKEKNTMGLSFLHKERKEKTPTQEITEETVYAEETSNEEPQIDNDFEHDCSSCQGCCPSSEEEKPLNELFEAETKDEFIAQDLIDEKEPEKTEQPEETTEIPVKEKPKKDLSEYKESKVDLGDVFKFKN